MGAGRFVCVLLPVLLTVAAIVSFLIATLTGVAHNRMYLFRLDTQNLTIDQASLASFADDLGVGDDLDSITNDINDLSDTISGNSRVKRLALRQDVQTDNITAQDLGMAKQYDVSFWGYCYVDFNDDRHCTDSEMNWAANTLNDSYLEEFASVSGVSIALPDEITGPLRAFREISRWTGIAFIVALVVLGVELVIGILSNFSRAISCVTWLVGLLAIIVTGVAAALATAQAAVVVGAVEATAWRYGVEGHINTRFLATIWIGFAFTLAASLFFLFTVCCCKNERRNRNRGGDDGEKFAPSKSYAPLGSGNDHEMTSGTGFYNPQQAPQYGAPYGGRTTESAYEPYSHRA